MRLATVNIRRTQRWGETRPHLVQRRSQNWKDLPGVLQGPRGIHLVPAEPRRWTQEQRRLRPVIQTRQRKTAWLGAPEQTGFGGLKRCVSGLEGKCWYITIGEQVVPRDPALLQPLNWGGGGSGHQGKRTHTHKHHTSKIRTKISLISEQVPYLWNAGPSRSS